MAPMVDLDVYEFKDLNISKITPEQSFTNYYAGETHESEQVYNYTKWLHVILDTKHEKTYLNKFMKNQCQNLTETQRNELLKLLQKPKELSDGTLGTWKTDPVGFEVK